MKAVKTIILAVICIAAICGLFFWATKKGETSVEDGSELSMVQEVITKDLDRNYPATPREVIRFYNKIVDCYYNKTFSDDELKKMVQQSLKLFDPELQAENPLDKYTDKIKLEIKDYKDNARSLAKIWVCDSNDVKYLTDTEKGDELAYVTTSYFVIERGNCTKTYQEYVLRKDEAGKWKILVFYRIEGAK